ncbi:MAG: twin-arginine translocase TatA/TatE family subunit [Myxococcota bacterium]|nr:twin-arginine translocase TatA/TatE family subunit [Myxococcota bacterium]
MSFAITLIGMPVGWEWIVILVVFMMLFGVGKLPEVGKKLGEGIRSFKKGMNADELDVTPSTEQLETSTEDAEAEKVG